MLLCIEVMQLKDDDSMLELDAVNGTSSSISDAFIGQQGERDDHGIKVLIKPYCARIGIEVVMLVFTQLLVLSYGELDTTIIVSATVELARRQQLIEQLLHRLSVDFIMVEQAMWFKAIVIMTFVMTDSKLIEMIKRSSTSYYYYQCLFNVELQSLLTPSLYKTPRNRSLDQVQKFMCY